LQPGVVGGLFSFSNEANSCYLDSLLTVLLLGGNQNFLLLLRERKQKLSDDDYKYFNKKSTYTAAEDKISIDKYYKDFAPKVELVLNQIYEELLKKKDNIRECSLVRTKFRDMLAAQFRETIDPGSQMSATALYRLLTYVFPKLTFTLDSKEFRILNWNTHIACTNKENYFILEEEKENFVLKALRVAKPDILVFENIKASCEQNIQNLLSGYSLMGFISRSGGEMETSGGHYVSAFKSNNQWYHYDDLKNGVIDNISDFTTYYRSTLRTQQIELLLYMKKKQQSQRPLLYPNILIDLVTSK